MLTSAHIFYIRVLYRFFVYSTYFTAKLLYLTSFVLKYPVHIASTFVIIYSAHYLIGLSKWLKITFEFYT